MTEQDNLKKKFHLAILALTTLFLLTSNAYAHTINVPSNCYFGIPTYGTYLNFNPALTFDTAYREGNNWYFDNSWFTIQNANLTFTNYFLNDKLIFVLTGSTGSYATVYFYAYGRSLTVTVEGADYATVNSSGVHTITKTLQSSATITVTWLKPSGWDSTPYVPPEEPPPYIPPAFLPSPKYVINFEYLSYFLLAVGCVLLISIFAKARKPKTIEALWRQKISTDKKTRLSPWIPIVAYVLFILVWFLVLRRLFYG